MISAGGCVFGGCVLLSTQQDVWCLQDDVDLCVACGLPSPVVRVFCTQQQCLSQRGRCALLTSCKCPGMLLASAGCLRVYCNRTSFKRLIVMSCVLKLLCWWCVACSMPTSASTGPNRHGIAWHGMQHVSQ
ncbi:hypothetical protein COO60DRAFT_1514131 [Scenedesmus sp. NREL 46B-D3]|nr:hypothetical protein COO60DRAFT_1514131 [Scenedesmus sp. NREL 46B-D3]